MQSQLAWSKENLKYPLFLFLLIFCAKIGYVALESFYNYYVLITTTSPDLNQETLYELNKNGHIISAIGITLLVVPFLYFVFKKFSTSIMYIGIFSSTILIYSISYNSLNYAVDYIVKKHKDERHDAYYINIFKYGLLNNIFAYNSFIDSTKLQGGLDVNDRILLTNTFLLLHADQELISKLKDRGKEAVAEVYIHKYDNGEYEKQFSKYKEATKQIADVWNKFTDVRMKLKQYHSKLTDESLTKKAHQELVKNLEKKYLEYKQSWKKVDEEIARQTSASKLESIKKDLKKYFKYQNYDKAKKEYKEKMNQSFGHYIEPYRWLNSYSEVTNKQIKKVIEYEIIQKALKKSNGIPKGLSAQKFAHNINVKIEVAKILKKEGILIPVDFDYSYASFKKYYDIAMTKRFNKGPSEFYKKLEENLGKNDLKLNFSWSDFIKSDFLKKQLMAKLAIDNNQDFKNLLAAIESKDLANFKRMVYLPKIIDEIEAMMFKKEDFKDGGIAEEKGNDAIKLLYIPPFALAISMLALLMNIVTVLSMSLKLINIKKSYAFAIKVIFAVIIISLPLKSDLGKLDNVFLESVKNEQINSYLQLLNWISYYESFNYKLHN